MSSCVYEIPRLLSLLVLACMLIYDRYTHTHIHTYIHTYMHACMCHENPQLDSAVRQIREVGGREVGWCGRTVARPTAGVGGRTLGWPKVAL